MPRFFRQSPAIFLLFILSTVSFSLSAANTIHWQQWAAETFAQAKKENKIIFLDVGTEWCGACQIMESFTYSEPEVIKLLNDNFITIKVDAEVQPDLGEKYSAWGWPALIFMTPDGTQVNEFAGNRRAATFIRILNTTLAKYQDGSIKDWKTELLGAAVASNDDISQLYQRSAEQLDGAFDEKLGGWGRGSKSPLPIHVEQAFFRGHVDNDAEWHYKALYTLDQTVQLIDPVWGGVYAAGGSNWANGIPEKILWKQAGAIDNFAEALHQTGDPRWLTHIMQVKNYLDRFLRRSDGAYFNSQDHVEKSFYELDDKARLAKGIPNIDKTVHTDINARVILSFLKVYQATADQKWLHEATQIAQVLIDERLTEGGHFRQVAVTEEVAKLQRLRELPFSAGQKSVIYLRTQAWMGRALLSLYGLTGEPKWLNYASDIGVAMQNQLLDPVSGGFYARDPQPGTPAPQMTLVDNAIASHFLFDLAYYTKSKGDPRLINFAQMALKAVGGQKWLDWEGRMLAEYVLALRREIAGPLEFSVIGSATDTDAKALFHAAALIYEPRKILKYEMPGRYPDLGKAALYVCSALLCSMPIKEAAKVEEAVKKFQVLIAKSDRI